MRAEMGQRVCEVGLWAGNSVCHRALGAGVTGVWGVWGGNLRSGSHLVSYSIFMQEADQQKQGRNKFSKLFCGLHSALLSDSGRSMQTMGNNQGEVALVMKINSEGFCMHMKSL